MAFLGRASLAAAVDASSSAATALASEDSDSAAVGRTMGIKELCIVAGALAGLLAWLV